MVIEISKSFILRVGFSYSADQTIVLNDKETAANAFEFLVNFFLEFPEFSHNDFYISGESYAGHYVPQLANQVLLGNKMGKSNIPLKGILVGNGVTDDVSIFYYLFIIFIIEFYFYFIFII